MPGTSAIKGCYSSCAWVIRPPTPEPPRAPPPFPQTKITKRQLSRELPPPRAVTIPTSTAGVIS